MIIGDVVTIGGGGSTASIFATSTSFTSSDSCVAVKGSKTYNGTWTTVQTPNPEYRNLPSGFTQVEYIQSSGSQYIDTGFKPLINRKIELDMSDYAIAQGNNFWGATNSGTQKFDTYYNNNTAEIHVRARDSSGQIAFSYISTRTVLSVVNNGSTSTVIYGGQTQTKSETFSDTSTWTTNICIFSNGAGTNTQYKLYGWNMYDSDSSIMELVPCLNTSTGKYGMYDMVSGEFFGDENGGTFTAGSTVPQYITSDYGFLISGINEYGTYTLTSTHSGVTKTQTVVIDSAERFDVTVTFSRLPSGYTEVEYIESSGTQYIDTGIEPTINSSYESKWYFNIDSIQISIYGCSLNNNPVTSWCGTQTGMNWRFGNIANAITLNTSGTYEITQNKSAVTINSTSYAYSSTGSISTSNPVYVFKMNGDTTYNTLKAKLYYFSISSSGTLQRNFVPCIEDSTDEVGMYDLVTSTFFGNDGTGVFTAGDPV